MLAFLVIYSLISIFWRWPDRLDRSGIFSLVLMPPLFCSASPRLPGRLLVSAMAALYLFLSLSSLHPGAKFC